MLFYSNVIIIGAGGTGSRVIPELLMYLSNLDKFGRLVIIDGDKLETKNLSRQLLANEPDKDKVDCLHVPNDSRILKVNQYVNNLQPYLRVGLNLVISCVDNQHTRHDHVQSLIDSSQDFIFISPGNATVHGQVVGFSRIDGNFTGINPLDIFPEWRNYKDRSPLFTSAEGKGCMELVEDVPQLQVTNMMAAMMTVHSVMMLTEGYLLPVFGTFNIEQQPNYLFTEVEELINKDKYII